MEQMLKFRPHHFLCTLGFQGKGYSPKFIANYKAICERLKSEGGDDTLITVVGDTDSICSPCPHRRGQTCTSQEVISVLDQAHAEVLAIKPGDQLTWEEAKRRLKQNMSLASFDKACASCSWKAMGICEQALRNLQSE